MDDTINFNSPFEFDSTLKSNIIVVNNSNSMINDNAYENDDELDLINNNNNQSKILNCDQDIIIKVTFFDKFNHKLVNIYSYLIPSKQSYPILCFLFVMVYTYLHSRVVIAIIENLSDLVKLTASFLGMTLISWGSNIGDTINACIATKIRAAELLTTSILSAQIINLQICLGVPWLILIIKGYIYSNNIKAQIYINFKKTHPLKYILPLFLVVLASIFILTIFGLNLNRRAGLCLGIVYLCHLIYEFNLNIN